VQVPQDPLIGNLDPLHPRFDPDNNLAASVYGGSDYDPFDDPADGGDLEPGVQDGGDNDTNWYLSNLHRYATECTSDDAKNIARATLNSTAFPKPFWSPTSRRFWRDHLSETAKGVLTIALADIESVKQLEDIASDAQAKDYKLAPLKSTRDVLLRLLPELKEVSLGTKFAVQDESGDFIAMILDNSNRDISYQFKNLGWFHKPENAPKLASVLDKWISGRLATREQLIGAFESLCKRVDVPEVCAYLFCATQAHHKMPVTQILHPSELGEVSDRLSRLLAGKDVESSQIKRDLVAGIYNWYTQGHCRPQNWAHADARMNMQLLLLKEITTFSGTWPTKGISFPI